MQNFFSRWLIVALNRESSPCLKRVSNRYSPMASRAVSLQHATDMKLRHDIREALSGASRFLS